MRRRKRLAPPHECNRYLIQTGWGFGFNRNYCSVCGKKQPKLKD